MSVLARLAEAARAWRRAVAPAVCSSSAGSLPVGMARWRGSSPRAVSCQKIRCGGLLPGGVGVGGDDDAGSSAADEGAERVGLCVGERGAERGDADVVAVAGEGDGERVEGAFDEDRDGAGGQRRGSLGEAVQLVALGEQVGLGGVEVLGNGSARFVAVVVGVAAADPAVDLRAVADGEDEPVAEAVDDPAGGGVAAEAGGDDLGVGGAEAAQVVGQRGPAGGGVAEGEPVVVGRSVPSRSAR